MRRYIAFPLIYIVLYQLLLLYVKNTWITIIIPFLILLPLIKGSRMKFNKSLLIIFLLSAFFQFMILEPAIALKKIVFYFPISTLPGILLYSLVFSISMVLILQSIKNVKFNNFYIPGIFFGIIMIFVYYPAYVIFDYKILFLYIVFHFSYIMFISFAIYFIFTKAKYNTIAPFTFLMFLSVFNMLSITINVSKYYFLMWEMISISLLLFLIDLSIKSASTFKNVFKGTQLHLKKIIKDSKGFIAVIIVIMVIAILISPGILQGGDYVVADPTGSMVPVIEPGSLLFVEHVNVAALQPGTIITFMAPWNHILYAHEIIKICYINGVENFRTKGVANPSPDPEPVPVTDVKGEVAMAIPYIGYILIYDRVVIAIAFIGFAMLLLLPEKKKKYRIKRGKRHAL